ncbi:hypothetical protein Prum_042900 [Phytohabitans rumicis]|uniref:SpaA-like prealbumin fold domain-containing protein n=2 Tax=Phytohabitans rumicis TaxID=1076125 RepID=A0A6V8L6K5_9ACTN|nr:hypothetical protein Prum_042900 [Phytohabitans rumicis]
MVLAPTMAAASHPEVSLPGSNFEIDTDANLKVDDPAPSIDWASVAETRKQDTASGPTDESFGQGSKEDTAVPSVVDGSIPPNKSDLKFFGVYQEGTTATGFLNLFWSRVQDPQGTTNMDFEFNQSSTLSSNGVTPVRTAGDLLIIYDLSQGGTNPQLFIRRWTGSAWGPATDLTASNLATGSINTSNIPAADSDGLGGQSARTFGEAQVKLSALFPNPNVCAGFGAAYLKSRSSDSFTAALKDFVPPVPVNISNCGSVKILKVDDAGTKLAGATFQLYADNAPVGGSRGAEDTLVAGKSCTTTLPTGSCTITAVLQGEYWVVETVVPPGHEGAADQHVTVTADSTVELTFVDPRQRGAILVTKLRKHVADGAGDHPHAGVDFTVNGVTKATDANGQACFDNLLFGSYTVHETTPANYQGEADKNVTVNNSASCADTPYAGETVTFTNTPLSKITVSFESQVPGGTAATIACTGLTATPPDGTPSAFDDTSETFQDLIPGTYTCTVVIDP